MNIRSFGIGGIHYRITGEDWPWIVDSCSCYEDFRISAESDYDVQVDIRVHSGPLPFDLSEEVLFVGGESWTLYRQGDRQVMVFSPPGSVAALWYAVFNEDGRQVDVFTSPPARNHPVPPCTHPLDQLILINALSNNDGVLIHGAGFGIHGKGILFAGRSGSGKSTMANLFSDTKGVVPVSDERMVVRGEAHGFKLYGTPWFSDAKVARSLCFPLSAVFFLNHGKSNKIEPCTGFPALERILPTASVPWYDSIRMQPVMDLCGRIVSSVPCYDLHFKPGPSIVREIITCVENLGPQRSNE